MNANFESHSISRRSFLKASGVVGAASILAACGGSSSSTAASTTASMRSARLCFMVVLLCSQRLRRGQ